MVRNRVFRDQDLCVVSEEETGALSGRKKTCRLIPVQNSFSAARSLSVNGGLGFSIRRQSIGRATSKGGKATSARRRRQGGRSNYEAAARKSDSSAMSFTRRVLSVKDGEEEEPGFIEIKFDSSRRVVNDGVLEHGGGGSCRLTTKDREVSRSRRSFKGWKWLFGHHHQRDSSS
ncbi:hypothetical protein Bca52824_058894 [Brassica carinata]|uniref:Uncharacterized protein n=1 Tax=Brassica carinata TaxID=52824 RepID=A0A8X7R0D1_BRACI|nr:hypothetical protein Bca52824_058894 [Brassica carinata]